MKEAYWVMIRGKRQAQKQPPAEPVLCDFCSKPATKVERLFSGPGGVHICNECVDICYEIILDFDEYPQTEKPADAEDAACRCSFCLKGRSEVEHLISGPQVHICNQCAVRFGKDIEGSA
jgi:ATP-dependent protease Clp ATPase subunit